MRWHHIAFKYAGRILMVGGALTGIFLLAFQSFRVAALLISAQLLVLLAWRLQESDNSGAWYVIRAKWIDIAVISSLLIGLTVFALWVPTPI